MVAVPVVVVQPSSSIPSSQSGRLLHRYAAGMHAPLPHRNSDATHGRFVAVTEVTVVPVPVAEELVTVVVFVLVVAVVVVSVVAVEVVDVSLVTVVAEVTVKVADTVLIVVTELVDVVTDVVVQPTSSVSSSQSVSSSHRHSSWMQSPFPHVHSFTVQGGFVAVAVV